jgi:hypothetical protein
MIISNAIKSMLSVVNEGNLENEQEGWTTNSHVSCYART